MGLADYEKKRDFRRTPEPSGKTTYRPRDERLSYVIQKHDASNLHYDFRLELDGVLKSWAVPKGPSLKTGVKRLAMETEDHPMEYGGFEGVIPKGQYGGGTVMLWDRGVWIPEGDPRKDYRRGRLRFRLEGEKLYGGWILTRMKPKPGEKKTSWLLIKSSDAAAREDDEPDITEEQPLSVGTGRDLDAIAADEDRVWDGREGEVAVDPTDTGAGSTGTGTGRRAHGHSHAHVGSAAELPGARPAAVPRRPSAQLATLTGKAPEGQEWAHELKFDGYRMLGRIEDGQARLITRNGKDWTDQFPEIAAALAGLPCDTAVVDGEVVALDRKGVSSFQLLQNSLSGARAGRPLLYAFDLLHLDGTDLTGVALEDRKAVLAELLADPPELIRYSDHVTGQGRAFFENACRMGLEGIISKRLGRPYRSGRSREWLKTKCTARQEFVIAGYSDPSGSRVGLGALLLGVHDDDGRLVYAGKVGTGFDSRTLVELEERLSRLEVKTSPLHDAPRGAKARGVHWIRPELVAEVEFTEWTEDGRVRHPSFQGLREDKTPEEVVREAPSSGGRSGSGTSSGEVRVAGVRVTSPERVVWPGQGVTKGELARYYEAVADVMLPRLVDRPLTLVRCPSGAEEKCFYQKHAQDSVPDVVPRVAVQEKDGPAQYMYVNGLPSLIALVQLGVLEFHVWGARRDRLERPDRLVFDLDPDEELPFGRVARAALDLRDRLADLGLASFPKSTGGKGLHVVVPITRRSDWDEARAFTQAVAQRIVAEDPDHFTAKMTKSRRTGRIFVDYLRNASNATAIADYSTRARPGAPVAMPLAWDELSGRERKPPAFTVREAAERVERNGDAWAGFDDVRQSITAAMKKAVA